MTPRRKLLIALAASALAPLLSFAQQPPATVPRIGILSPFNSSSDTFRDAVQQRLRELGYAEGRNIVIEYRASEDMADRLPQLAADLVNLKVDAIVTTTAAGVQATKQATGTIPIIMAGVDDAVDQGFVASLAKPGGNITGTSWLNTELLSSRKYRRRTERERMTARVVDCAAPQAALLQCARAASLLAAAVALPSRCV